MENTEKSHVIQDMHRVISFIDNQGWDDWRGLDALSNAIGLIAFMNNVPGDRYSDKMKEMTDIYMASLKALKDIR